MSPALFTNEPERKVTFTQTMPEEIKRELTMEEFKDLIDQGVEAKIRELNMDSVDRKHGMFPTKDDPNGDDLKNLSKEDRVKKFMQAVIAGNHTEAKALSEGTSADGGYLVP